MGKLLSQEIKSVILLSIIVSISLMVGRVSALGLGMYGGAHLRAPVGATGLSIGGAQTASPKYQCSLWNPAAIVNVRQKKASGISP